MKQLVDPTAIGVISAPSSADESSGYIPQESFASRYYAKYRMPRFHHPMLQNFLENGLLEIGDDAAKFDYLAKAAKDLAKNLSKHKAKLISYTLIALDSEASSDDGIFLEVEIIIKKHWTTLRAKFTDMPRQILRAVIWEALEIAGQDVQIGAIVWLVGGACLPYSRLEPRGIEICRSFLRTLGTKAEEKAEADWALDVNFEPTKLPEWKVAIDGKDIKVDINALKVAFGRAAGPSNENGVNFKDPNQYWPNSGQHWSYQFAPRAAEAIANVLDPVVKTIGAQIKPLENALKDHVEVVNNAVEAALNQALNRVVGHERRTRLLWWKEALYSPSEQRGYRDMESPVAALLMSFDIHTMVIPFSPQSVEFLLRETVRKIASPESPKLTLGDFVRKIASEAGKLGIASRLPCGIGGVERVCLAEFIGSVVSGKTQIADIVTRVGVSLETIIPVEEVAVWIYRDFQALRLVRGK